MSIINTVESYVQNKSFHNDSGHDYSHSDRVRKLALQIASSEEFQHLTEDEKLIIELSALLHDVGDEKFYKGNENENYLDISKMLLTLDHPNEKIKLILEIIKNLTFGKGNINRIQSDCFHIVRDADRLEAIGAIGIARAFHYGGFKGDFLYYPKIKPRDKMTYREYREGESTTINHFYEKLFKIKDSLVTKEAQKIAIPRDKFMRTFINTFLQEWNLGKST